MTVEFGDDEPEDAWSPDDPVAVQINDLIRRVELLVGYKVRFGEDHPTAVLDAIAQLVVEARQRDLSHHDLVRADELDEDVAFVRGRI